MQSPHPCALCFLERRPGGHPPLLRGPLEQLSVPDCAGPAQCDIRWLMSTRGEGDLHGCRPIQGIECTLSQETHPLPGTRSRHCSCLGPQSTREAVLVRGDGFVLCLAGRGEQAVPCCDIQSGLVLSQLAKAGEECFLSASAHPSGHVLAAC